MVSVAGLVMTIVTIGASDFESLRVIAARLVRQSPFDGGYGVSRAFRIVAEIGASLASLVPAYMFFTADKCRSSCESLQLTLFWFALFLGVLLRLDIWWTKGSYEDVYSLVAGLRQNTFSELFYKQLGFNQSAPIGFCLLEKALGELSGWDARTMRLPLLIAGISTLFLMLFAARESGIGRTMSACLVALVAVSPPLVLYSGELKQYGLDPFFAVLTLFVALQMRSEHPIPWKTLSFLFITSPFFSHTQLFLLPALLLCLMERIVRDNGNWHIPSKTVALRFSLCATGCAIAAFSAFFHASQTMPQRMFTWWEGQNAFPPLAFRPAAKWWLLKAVFFFRNPFPVMPFRNDGGPGLVLSGLLPLVMLGGGCLSCISWKRKLWTQVVFAVVAAALLVTAAMAKKWIVVTGSASANRARHLLFLLPLAYLIFGSGLLQMRRATRWLPWLLVSVSFATHVFRLATDNVPSWHMEDSVDILSKHHIAGEPVLMGFCQYRAAMACAPAWMDENHADLHTRGIPGQKDPIPEGVAFVKSHPQLPFWMFFDKWHPGSREMAQIAKGFLQGRVVDFSHEDTAGVLLRFSPSRHETESEQPPAKESQ